MYQSVYCHFVAYSADSSHDNLKSFYEVTERLALSLGHAPKIDIGGFLVYEHRVLLEKIRGEFTKASSGIPLQAREPFERCSLEIFDEEAAFAGISFAFSGFGSPHCDLESFQVCSGIGCSVIRRYPDLSMLRNPSSGDAGSKRWFLRFLEQHIDLGCTSSSVVNLRFYRSDFCSRFMR